jgi:hypothetical protein
VFRNFVYPKFIFDLRLSVVTEVLAGGRYESQGIGKKAVPQLQGGAAQGCGPDHLLRPATQATPGLMG